MNSSFDILVIILSVTLAIMLVLSIVCLIKFIEVLNRVKVILERAENVAQKAEEMGEFLKKSAGPMALAKIIGGFVKGFKRAKRKG